MSAGTVAPQQVHQQRPVRLGWLLSTLGVWLAAFIFAAFCWFGVHGGVHGLNARVYWNAARSLAYGAVPGAPDAYLYPPPFALAIWPLARLPLQAFIGVWMLLEAVAFGWLLKPMGWRWGVPLFLMCFAELVVGNINAFLAAMLVVGTNRGAPWTLALLTKVTPSIGLLWFVTRRTWRPLAMALGATLIIVAGTAVAVPEQWSAWLRFAFDHQGQSEWLFPARLAIAAGIVLFAGRRDHAWLLPIALILAQPVHEWMSLTLLSAVPRLTSLDRRRGEARA